jgi:RimJ/RimL family protein N-acetyltransferase
MAEINKVRLRELIEADLPIFFEQERDPEARYMAAFTSKDPDDYEAFRAHQAKVRSNPDNIRQTILVDEQVAGSIASFLFEGEPTIGYWLGREFWGKGIATQAVKLFLETIPERPLYARVAHGNPASLRVLEKNGFIISGEDKGFANARNAETEEYILILRAAE